MDDVKANQYHSPAINAGLILLAIGLIYFDQLWIAIGTLTAAAAVQFFLVRPAETVKD